MTETTLYWDDLAPGFRREGGAFRFDEAAIKRFAAEFDPRPTHLDDDAARASLFQGLSASGAHTFAAWARLYWEQTRDWATQAGSRVSDLRFLRPVRPGCVLALRLEIVGKRAHPFRGGRFGFLALENTLVDAAGRRVFAIAFDTMIERRP